MPIEWPTLIEGGIPILGGLYATGLGYGFIRNSSSLPSAQWQKALTRFRWLGPAVVLFGVFTAWQAHEHISHPSAEELARQIAARLSFPLRVDEITQLTGVEGHGNQIIYKASITSSLNQLGGREAVQRNLEGHLVSVACKDKNYEKLLRAGYSLQMRYSFKQSSDEILISIPPRACGY